MLWWCSMPTTTQHDLVHQRRAGQGPQSRAGLSGSKSSAQRGSPCGPRRFGGGEQPPALQRPPQPGPFCKVGRLRHGLRFSDFQKRDGQYRRHRRLRQELELKLTQRGVGIAYAPDAVVLDEKVDNPTTFARQRGRWLAAQYRYGRRFAGAALLSLFDKRQFDFFNKTLQMALPPRVVLPGVLAFGTPISVVLQLEAAPIWALLLAGNLLSFGLSIPRVIGTSSSSCRCCICRWPSFPP